MAKVGLRFSLRPSILVAAQSYWTTRSSHPANHLPAFYCLPNANCCAPLAGLSCEPVNVNARRQLAYCDWLLFVFFLIAISERPVDDGDDTAEGMKLNFSRLVPFDALDVVVIVVVAAAQLVVVVVVIGWLTFGNPPIAANRTDRD